MSPPLQPVEPLSFRLTRLIQWQEDLGVEGLDEDTLELLREALRVVSQYENLLPVMP